MSSSELYNGEVSEGIGERSRKPLMFHMKHISSANAHATKEYANRRHTNHMIRKGFRQILPHFGANVSMAQIGAFGACGNNRLQLYIGECPIPVALPFVADHIESESYIQKTTTKEGG